MLRLGEKRGADGDEQAPSHGPFTGWRGQIHEIIYEADTFAGKAFDVALIFLIALSVLVVMLESVESITAGYARLLRILEWVITVLFSIEYVLRLLSVRHPLRYATSFYGIIDMLAIAPTYLSVIFPSTRFLLVIRILRMFRVFRVLKLGRYLSEGDLIVRALKASRVKIFVFIYSVVGVVVIIGSVMYVIEGDTNPGFDSIPRGVYWAIVTLTTVGYGDIAPQTALGQFLSAVVMILGYGMIAVPTGIVTAEMSLHKGVPISTQACPGCSREGHDHDAGFCKHCGEQLY